MNGVVFAEKAPLITTGRESRSASKRLSMGFRLDKKIPQVGGTPVGQAGFGRQDSRHFRRSLEDRFVFLVRVEKVKSIRMIGRNESNLIRIRFATGRFQKARPIQG